MTAAQVTAITGGTVVTPDGQRRADVLISGATIAAVRPAGSAAATAGQVIDAAGCYVLPGGVDPHAHLMAGVAPATAAAGLGGTTTALSFTNPDPGERDLDSLLRRVAQVSGDGAVIDVGLHAMLYDPDRATAADLAAAQRAGAAAVKVFLAYPELGIMCSEQRLFELMTAASRVGLLVQVHCENGPLIQSLEAQVATESAAAPRRSRGARVFADTRPPEVEQEAVAAALAIAALAGAPCYLVHLSTAQAIEQVRLARRRPRPPVFAEVCPHHLLLDDRRYAGPDAGRYLVAPPLRAAEHAGALWSALADGTVDAVGSDHCQTRSAVPAAILAPGEKHEYGIAGIGARVPLLLSEGLARGIPLTRLSQLLAENPARIFRHFPRKGALVPGSDADVLVFDPAGEAQLGPDAFDDGTGPSVYAGRRIRGRVRDVLLRGRPLVAAGRPVPGPASGRYQAADDQPERGPGGLASRD